MAATFAMAFSLTGQSLQFAELGKRHLPTDEYRTRAVAYGDVDGDGDLDLVCGNEGPNQLYINDGAGVFVDATAGRLPAWSKPTYALAFGDIDGDGDLDLVCGNGAFTGAQNRLFVNNGTGIFTDATAQLPTQVNSTSAIALADFDSDGDLDILCGDRQNHLYLNNGSGTFVDVTATHLPPDPSTTQSLALGDVDGDGDLDFVAANYNDWGALSNRLCLNDGLGVFSNAPAGYLPVDFLRTSSVVLGDVDNDGDLDLVTGQTGSAIPAENQNRLFLNNGSGIFADVTSQLPVDNDLTQAVALADFDGDGDLDLTTSNCYDQQNRLYENDGGGTFHDVTAAQMPADTRSSYAIAVCDVDGDGDLDFVQGNGDFFLPEPNMVGINDGAGRFTDGSTNQLPLSESGRSIALGDIDGDGDLDLVYGRTDQVFEAPNLLLRNNGSGAFEDVTATQMPANNDGTFAVVLGDVDGDGDLDLICGNSTLYSGAQNRFYLNDGTGTFSDATASHMPIDNEATYDLVIGDVDNDGDLDLICGNGGNLSVDRQDRLYLNNGSGVFADVTATQMPVDSEGTTSLAFCDIDSDGDLDLICAGKDRLYVNDGAGTFTDATSTQLPTIHHQGSCIAIGDVDGDSDPDILFGGRSVNLLFLNDGSGTFILAPWAQLPTGRITSSAIALSDIDLDGDLDVVIGDEGNGSGGQNRLWWNDGNGLFTDASAKLPARLGSTWAIAVADIDGDLEPDLVVGNRLTNRLYTNLRRQLHAPTVLRPGQPYTFEAYSRFDSPNAVDFAGTSLSTTRLSIALPPFGILGVDPMAVLPVIAIPQPTGVGSVQWNVPNVATISGIEIFAQAIMVSSDLRLTNVTADTIQ